LGLKNEFVMEPWIIITDLGKGKTKVQVEMGNLTEVKNLPDYHALPFARMTVLSAIRRYINHRRQVCEYHGGYLNPSQNLSLNKLEYAWSGEVAQRWDLHKMATVICRYQNDFLNILPGRKSKFHQSHSKFLSDLLGWANYAAQIVKSKY